MTAEQQDLFTCFVAFAPDTALAFHYDAVAIDEVNEKRVLCLQLPSRSKGTPVFLHFHPEGLTEAEMLSITQGHEQDSVTYHDSDTLRWSTIRTFQEAKRLGTTPKEN